MKEAPRERIGIIGAGWSGLFAAKHCLESGLSPTVFEASDLIGGQWTIPIEENNGGVLNSTHTVSSKHYMSPQDFPYPEEAPEFLSAHQVKAHLEQYAAQFKLHPHIKLNHAVRSVKKGKNGWIVTTDQSVEYFSKLVIATGANSIPRIPTEAMYKNFTGKMQHSSAVKEDIEQLNFADGERVLIVGGSDTAADYACLISEKAKVSVSIRSGAWFQDRFVDDTVQPSEAKGFPADMFYNRLVDYFLHKTNYKAVDASGFPNYIENTWGKSGSGIPEWRSRAGYLETYYVKSRHLVKAVRAGNVIPRAGITRIEGKLVYFDDDRPPQEFDRIIFCTGFTPTLKFDSPVQPHENLYRKTVNIDDPTIAFIGYNRPYLTSITMIAEMQARWLMTFFSGEKAFPDQKVMVKRAINDEKKRRRRFPLFYEKMPGLIDPYETMETLAKDIGVSTSYAKVRWRAPKLARVAYTGSWSHFLYRIFDTNDEKREVAQKELELLKSHPVSRSISSTMPPTIGWLRRGLPKPNLQPNDTVSLEETKVYRQPELQCPPCSQPKEQKKENLSDRPTSSRKIYHS